MGIAAFVRPDGILKCGDPSGAISGARQARALGMTTCDSGAGQVRALGMTDWVSGGREAGTHDAGTQ